MKTRTPWIAAVFVFLTLPVLPAVADELIRFKSGYEMMVMSHREENGMIFLTLLEGGEVGFPKEVLDLIEEGKESLGPHRYRGSGYNRVPSRGIIPRAALPENLPSRVLAKGASRYNGVTVGYSYAGQKQERFNGGPVGPMTATGRIGISIWDQRTNETAASPSKDPSKAKKPAAPTVAAEGLSEGD